MLCHPELHPGLTYALRNAKSRQPERSGCSEGLPRLRFAKPCSVFPSGKGGPHRCCCKLQAESRDDPVFIL